MNTWINIENKNCITLVTFDRIVIALLAVSTTILGLFLAVLLGGPLARALFGVPIGFREHFTSDEALRQALFVQAVTVGFAFLLFGLALRRKVGSIHFRWAVWAANPVTVAVGFVIYKLMYEYLPLPHDVEYYHVRNGAILAIAAPFVFAFCFLLGTRLFNMIFHQT